jgi:DNA-binding transcriptional ArsR family regulator
METRRDVFQAIADPTRRAILALLVSQSLTPGAIAKHFDSARQTISKHIQILTECQLLTQKTFGREIYYQINPKKMKAISDWAEQFHSLWEGRFNHMEKVLSNLKKSQP